MNVEKPNQNDIDSIYNLINSIQYEEKSLFHRSKSDIYRNLSSFIVSRNNDGEVIGCVSVYTHSKCTGEIRTLVVDKNYRGLSIGYSLVKQSIFMCSQEFKFNTIWVDTQRPKSYVKLGFRACSRWKMPKKILLTKLIWILRQPFSKWYPSLTGSFTPMYTKLKRPELRSL
jgi:N-acetylglutamate synthase-like GNAT family acetyltransferase